MARSLSVAARRTTTQIPRSTCEMVSAESSFFDHAGCSQDEVLAALKRLGLELAYEKKKSDLPSGVPYVWPPSSVLRRQISSRRPKRRRPTALIGSIATRPENRSALSLDSKVTEKGHCPVLPPVGYGRLALWSRAQKRIGRSTGSTCSRKRPARSGRCSSSRARNAPTR